MIPSSSAKELSTEVCWETLKGQGRAAVVARKGTELRELETGTAETIIRKRASGDSGVMRPEACPQEQLLVDEGPHSAIHYPSPRKKKKKILWPDYKCKAYLCKNSNQHRKL